MDELKQFSIADIQEVTTEESAEFAIARIAVLSTRPNSHGINITEEILRRDGKSVLGKWVVAKYDHISRDVTTHEQDEVIVGIVPHDATIDFVETEDGYLVMYVDAIISKIYATDVYKLFTKDNFRNTSVEMQTKNDVILPNGTTDIDGLNIVGITILGCNINGSCPDANMTITKFSEEEATKFYDKNFALNKIKNMANDLLDFANAQLELESKGEIMEENREFSEQPKDEDIVMAEGAEVEAEDNKEMAETEVEEPKNEESTDDSENKEMSENTEEMGCGEEEKEMSEETPTEMAEPNEDEAKDSVEEKTFAEQCVECADENYKEFVEKLFSAEIADMVNEVVELKKFMDSTIKANTEKRFAEIMVEPKLCLGEKAYNVLFAEGSNLSLSELDAFEQKVKAFCEDAPKKSENNDEMLMFAGNDTENVDSSQMDVWARIANN